ncbi:hypothetical protein N0V94_002456 [Neodidymelliopsis sp. IMI 364377]|nr:hypothetical protein N0V94_002456 [Neodidymelliopsis sp. IMI 364377]
MRNTNDKSLFGERHAAHKATLGNPPGIATKSPGKVRNKPGPRPYASKPIMKNDMAAKIEVIREIESFWGKGFIKSYIPKCHRPLVKRGKTGKRAMYREHETDPKKWLPSVLKAVLMIAKLTSDKKWLKKAMNDVVRYRIKNTGNRKPQLVTTDFDVIEDMLVKDWDVAFSFNIRYKHLILNRQGQQETDEDVDHILAVVDSDQDDGSDVEDDDDIPVGKVDCDDDDDYVDDEEGGEHELSQGGVTGQCLHASGYISAPHYPQPCSLPEPLFKNHRTKQERANKRRAELPARPQPSPYNKGQQSYPLPYPYGPPMDRWGRSMHYGFGPDSYGYGGYGMYSGHAEYGPPQDSDGSYPSPPSYRNLSQHAATPRPNQSDVDHKNTRDSSLMGDTALHRAFERSPFSMSRPGFPSRGYPEEFQNDPSKVKRESPEAGDGRALSVDEFDKPENNIGDNISAAALEAELRATELELKVARLQAKRAAMNQQSRAK